MMNGLKIRDIIMCALFAALIAVGAFIRIPVPAVPFTLQTLFVVLAGLLLGKKLGAISALVYMCIGLVGIPVFTQGGGISYVLKPTFGYILGFIAGAYITGAMAQKGEPTLKRLLLACFAGMGVIYACGMVYYYLISHLYLGTNIGVWPLFLYCFLVFIPGDGASCVVAALLAKRLLPVLKHGKA